MRILEIDFNWGFTTTCQQRKGTRFFFYLLFSFFFCFLIFSVIRRNPPPLLSASPSETIDDSVGHHGVFSVFSVSRALETYQEDNMIWMLITVRRGQHDLDADYRHKRTALPQNSLFNSSILGSLLPLPLVPYQHLFVSSW